MSDAIKISPEKIRELVDYNPETGVFTWRERPLRPGMERHDKAFNTRHANKQAGGPDHYGYVHIMLTVGDKRHLIKAHRLAWFYMTGIWPPELDHRNMNRADNRFANLRIATSSQNKANTLAQSNSKSGIKGVSFDKVNNLWRVNITKDGKTKNLGRYPTLEEAAAVRRKHAIELFGEFANESSPVPVA